MKLVDAIEIAGKVIVKFTEVYSKKVDGITRDLKFKVRLAARGDLFSTSSPTYAPVAQLSVIRLFFAMRAEYQLEILQPDVSSAFLQSKVYSLPKGHRLFGQNKFWRSPKAVYGLREARRLTLLIHLSKKQ